MADGMPGIRSAELGRELDQLAALQDMGYDLAQGFGEPDTASFERLQVGEERPGPAWVKTVSVSSRVSRAGSSMRRGRWWPTRRSPLPGPDPLPPGPWAQGLR